MNVRALALLLSASSAALADKAWVIEPGQALVSVELGPDRARLSATSLGMSGRLRELAEGGVAVEIRVAVASFTTGAAERDQQLKADAAQFPELVFTGTAPDAGETLRLQGTLTLHGISRPLPLKVQTVRAGGMLFGHALFTLHLRDYGFALPPGAPDEVRVEVDAGLHPEGALLSRG